MKISGQTLPLLAIRTKWSGGQIDMLIDRNDQVIKNVSFFYLNSTTRSWPSKSG